MELKVLRRELHKNAELSGKEDKTASIIKRFIGKEAVSIGGNGLMFVFDSGIEGPTLLLRCDMDALPIKEENDLPYSSSGDAAHLCGHDGHMTILAGVAKRLEVKKGKVVLLFQPEEETGYGALKVLSDDNFIIPDYCFALHNIPGYDRGSVLVKEGNFASASSGLVVKLKGKTSHAGEPSKGLSPSKAVASIISKIDGLTLEEGTFATIIHAKIGKIAFGTSPGEAVVMATLRSYSNEGHSKIKKECEKICSEEASEFKIDISYVEEFSAVFNSKECVNVLEGDVVLEKPFSWSEDFGYFTDKYKGAMFGLGAGDVSDLHNPDYDFPDDVIEKGVEVFLKVVHKYCG